MTPADKPTFWFIGVTTAQSSIMRVFPEWARHLGLGDVAMRGIDLVPHDRAERYREVVAFLKSDPLSLGALVTTHKLDLFAAARDMFDEIDPHARLMEETSCLSKRNGRLVCHAKDPTSRWARAAPPSRSPGTSPRPRGASTAPRASSSRTAAPPGSSTSPRSTRASATASPWTASSRRDRRTTTRCSRGSPPARSSSTPRGSARTRRARPSPTRPASPSAPSPGT